MTTKLLETLTLAEALAEARGSMPEPEYESLKRCTLAAIREQKAELEKQAEQEPVYAFRRRGLNDFCTCTKERYEELVDKPNLFEVTTFYTAPVSAEAIRARGPNVTPG